MLHRQTLNTGQKLQNITSCFHCVFLSLPAHRARNVCSAYEAAPIVAHRGPFVNSYCCVINGNPALFPATKNAEVFHWNISLYVELIKHKCWILHIRSLRNELARDSITVDSLRTRAAKLSHLLPNRHWMFWWREECAWSSRTLFEPYRHLSEKIVLTDPFSDVYTELRRLMIF